MNETRSVRLLFDGAPSPSQLKGLRAAFDVFAKFPPAELRALLAETPVCVAGSFLADHAEALVERVVALGIGAESFTLDDYGAPYLRAVLPEPPPSWESAELAMELVFLPSFAPEVIVRLWSKEADASLQLATLNANLWYTRFSPPPWLRTESRRLIQRSKDADSSSKPRPAVNALTRPSAISTRETVAVDANVVTQLMALARRVPDVEPEPMLDGMQVELAYRPRDPADSSFHSARVPLKTPAARALLPRLHALTWDHLMEPDSRRRLEDLHEYLGLGPNMHDLGGVPRVVRLWGSLTVYDETWLRELFAQLSAYGGVVDLSDVRGMATRLEAVFRATDPRVHLVHGRHRALLEAFGVGDSRLHATRVDAVTACGPL